MNLDLSIAILPPPSFCSITGPIVMYTLPYPLCNTLVGTGTGWAWCSVGHNGIDHTKWVWDIMGLVHIGTGTQWDWDIMGRGHNGTGHNGTGT